MSLFPRIARPCPYIDRLDAVMDGDFCRMCKRQVHDLTDMDDAARAAFLNACGGDACVSYVALVPAAIATAMVAASAAALVVPDSAYAARHKAKAAKVRKADPPYVPIMLGGAPPPIPQQPDTPPEPAVAGDNTPPPAPATPER